MVVGVVETIGFHAEEKNETDHDFEIRTILIMNSLITNMSDELNKKLEQSNQDYLRSIEENIPESISDNNKKGFHGFN